MVWSKNTAIREFSAKRGYRNCALESYQGEKELWWKLVWKNEVSLKAKITLWLALSNKFLT